MSEARGNIKTNLDYDSVIKAIQRAGRSFGSLVESGKGKYEIKDNVQRTDWSTTWPATTEINVSSSFMDKTVDISLYSHNFGIGPIQRKECESKLGAVKGAIEEEIDKIKKENTSSSNDNMEALINVKKLLDMGVITQEEFDAKKKQLLGL